MSKLLEIYARHGAYNGFTGELTEEGIAQSRVIAEFVATQLNVPIEKALILCGQSTRTIQTARIIGERIYGTPEETRYLGGPEGKSSLEDWMFNGLRPFFDGDHSLFICVTHNQQAVALAKRARKNMFGAGGDPDIYELETGTAFVVDHRGETIFQYPQ